MINPKFKVKILSPEEEKKFKDMLREDIIQQSKDHDELDGINFTEEILLQGDTLERWVEREFRIRTTTKCPSCKDGYKEFNQQMCKDCSERLNDWGNAFYHNASKERKTKWFALRRKWEKKNFTDKEASDLIKDWGLDI